MDKMHKSYPDLSMDMYFTVVVSELRKQKVELSNNLINRIMDRMAKESMPKGTWDYVSGKVMDNNIVKSVFDFTHPSAADTPFEKEIKRRAELMYKPSFAEKTTASIATASMDVGATAPIAVLCPSSVVYGFLIQGGYDIANDKIFLPESKEERTAAANDAIRKVKALDEKSNWKIVPAWMKSKYGITDYKTTDEKTLTETRDWARRNADWWKAEYEKLCREKKDVANVNGKKFTRNECLVKFNQYENFRADCQRELTSRWQEAMKRESSATEVTFDSVGNEDESGNVLQSVKASSGSNDPWGAVFNGLGFNGLGNVGKHLGITLANLPDMILGVFTGKTKSVGMNADTMIPLASLVLGKFTHNPLLKTLLMGYGGLNLVNKLGNEALNQYQGKQERATDGNVQYKHYEDEPLNSRIANVQIVGNTLLADIDRKPCTIALNDTAIKAYEAGALPLNTLANAVLAKSDTMKQQASQAYENSQQQQQSRGIR